MAFPNSGSPRPMPLTDKGLYLLLGGFLVMVSGFILMMGGGSDNPSVFSYAMFDFQRLVIAPIVILCGVAVMIIAIVRVPKEKKKEEDPS